MKQKYTQIKIITLLGYLILGQTTWAAIDTIQWIARLDTAERFINLEYEQEYRAIQLATKSMKLKRSYYGENSEQYLLALLRLSELYSQRGISNATNNYHRLAYTPYMEKLRSDFCQLSENQKALYWQTASAYINQTMSIAYNQSLSPHVSDGSAMTAAAYNAQLLSKGLLLNLSIDIERYVKASNNPQAMQLLTQRKHLLNTTDMSIVDSIDLQILEILRASGQPYHIDNLSLTWQQVQSKLKKNDLAIEFFRTNNGQYGALLLKTGWKTPKIVPLRNTYKQDRKHKYSLEEVLENDIMDNPAPMIWTNQMLQYFPKPGEGTIYFAADGLMLQKGIEYLPFVDFTNSYTGKSETAVMSDVYDMVRLSSTRELVLHDSTIENHSAVVYGGIRYNANIEEFLTESQAYDTIPMSTLNTTPPERTRAIQLPGTLVEANTIYDILNSNNISTKKYFSVKANEESFKSLNGLHCNIIHIATHGFMWSGETDPMNRCGLLFSGANIALSRLVHELPQGVQDGILTAKEISQLDLNDCDIAVLSACETAAGDVTSEGVFGLQRAFKMAGVQTIIMSLWKVDDAATQLLMTEFYTNWIIQHQTKHEAFKNAQNAVRFATDENGHRKYDNPIYWSGFIMMD